MDSGQDESRPYVIACERLQVDFYKLFHNLTLDCLTFRMHPDLAEHLHSDECVQLIAALKVCHNEHKVGRLFGKCNHLDSALNECLRRERALKRDNNRNRKKKLREGQTE